MTKEQEVIKYIETRIKICNENADICDDNDFDEEATYLREESYMLETVLSMLKEKDKEIKTLTQTNKSYKGIINKKDRQIDLMARAFKQDDVRTVEEIKQYFERKSKE